ncbi:MAG: hypothetical protein ACTXOO_02200 [Sodalis sp. (in: enterobacteria)]
MCQFKQKPSPPCPGELHYILGCEIGGHQGSDLFSDALDCHRQGHCATLIHGQWAAS